MITKHDCWWTRTHRSELTNTGDAIVGAGCPREVLEHAAGRHGTELRERPSEDDEYGQEVSLGAVAGGLSHDDCFFELRPVSVSLKRLVVGSVLELHATYLGKEVDWSGVVEPLAERLAPNTSMRIRSRVREQRLAIRVYPRGSGLLRRLVAKAVLVDCTEAKAVIP
jgi:hypothetical protein